jgi:hypothetical protein
VRKAIGAEARVMSGHVTCGDGQPSLRDHEYQHPTGSEHPRERGQERVLQPAFVIVMVVRRVQEQARKRRVRQANGKCTHREHVVETHAGCLSALRVQLDAVARGA